MKERTLYASIRKKDDEEDTAFTCLRRRNSMSGLHFEIPKPSVSLSLSLALALFPFFLLQGHVRRTDELTNIQDMHMLRSRRSGRADKDCNSRFPVHRVAKRRFSRLTLCNDVCKMLSDCDQNSVAQCTFRYPTLISAACDNLFIE